MSNITDSQRLAAVFRELRRFSPESGSSTGQLAQHIAVARSVIEFLDQTSLLQRAARLEDQIAVVARLQDLAYHEPDSGGIADIARWCVRQWLRLLQQYGENVGTLRGLGQAWLLRSQPSIARIQIDEGSSSSSLSTGQGRSPLGDAVDELVDTAHAASEANSRRHTAYYVEARGTLIPATEYLARAVSVAERQGILDGQLLSLAAEAYMSLGNVSYQPANERLFRQALIYLYRASRIPGFALTSYLQSYLDDYGRLID